MSNKREPLHTDYWDDVEAALTALPETYPLRAKALASFDRLKEVITEGRPSIEEPK